MDNLIKLFAIDANTNKIFILVSIIVFLIFAILLFIYLAGCIVVVKQGTRKIVERFGSYNRTLKEGLHIIFRPFDRIVPVPWNVLSISERDEFEKNKARATVRYFNDKQKKSRLGRNDRTMELEERRIDEARAAIYKKLEKDIRMQMREKYIDNSDHVSAAFGDTLDINAAVYRASGRRMSDLMADVVRSEDSLNELELAYREMGLDFYRADKSLLNAVREKDALAASIRYYPRHQDPHSKHAGRYAMAENHVQDYVDLRERHIDTSRKDIYEKYVNTLENSDVFFYESNTHGASTKDNALDAVRRGVRRNVDPDGIKGVKLITKDNAYIGANIVIFFAITDPFLYYYGVEEPEESLVLLAITTLRNIVSSLTLEEALQARSIINKKIREELDIATNNWGIKANRVEVKDFDLSYNMKHAMSDVLIAEREKRSEILRAEGKAEAYRKIKEAEVTPDIIKLEGYKTLQSISEGPANKVFIPNDLSDFITGAHVIADAFKDGKKEEKPVIKTIKEEIKAAEEVVAEKLDENK